MEFKIENLGNKFNAEIVQSLGNSEYIIKIQEKERNLKILSMTPNKIEFMLDNEYHVAKYLDNNTAKMTVVVDDLQITFDKHSELDKIVYKNSGAESGGDSQLSLRSQIPGRRNICDRRKAGRLGTAFVYSRGPPWRPKWF